MAFSSIIARCSSEEYHNQVTIILLHIDSVLTSSSLIITVRTYLIQQINIQQQRLNMMTPTSPASPKTPRTPLTPASIVSQLSPVEQYMSDWMPSTPILRPAVTHIQISSTHSRMISTQLALGSPLDDMRLRDAILSPRTRQNVEEMVISPIAEQILCVPHKSTFEGTLQRLTSPPPPRRKRSLNSDCASEQRTPSLPSNAAQRIAEFDSRRPCRKPLSFRSHSRKSKLTNQSSTPKIKLHLKRRPHPLLASIKHLATPLIPLISVVTGLPHPEFPVSLLQYHLLTHSQLDSLARWYHQTTDSGPERAMYPAVIRKAWTTTLPEDDDGEDQVDLEVKRRRFGRFIGLRGCESPVVESFNVDGQGDAEMRNCEDSEQSSENKEMEKMEKESKKESIEEKMEREWRLALARAEEERITMEKSWRGRF